MSDFTTDFVDAVRAVIAEAWPETKANGIYEHEHVETIPWKELSPPYAVMVLNEFEPIEGGGVDLYHVPLQIYGVFTGEGEMEPVRVKLAALLRGINRSALSLTETPRLSASSNLPPNAFFIEAKNTRYRAGRLDVGCLIGVSHHE
jgi:hypothetical protein